MHAICIAGHPITRVGETVSSSQYAVPILDPRALKNILGKRLQIIPRRVDRIYVPVSIAVSKIKTRLLRQTADKVVTLVRLESLFMVAIIEDLTPLLP